MEYEDFKEKLKNINLTIKDFAKLSETSYRTCISWSMENRKIPNWVNAFLNIHIENKRLKENNTTVSDREYQELLQLKASLQNIMSGTSK